MSLLNLTDPDAVEAAIRECDELGRDGFLEKHGFHRAKRYFVVKGGRLYDSKAIAAVAHGYQLPEVGPLGPSEFSGGERTAASRLRGLGFEVREVLDPHQPLVLVENEKTAGGRYDHWKDVTGERYHFPNQYKGRVVPGRQFVYYRGVRRADGSRGTPEYFGYGRIGDVWRDSDVPEGAPHNRGYCRMRLRVAAASPSKPRRRSTASAAT